MARIIVTADPIQADDPPVLLEESVSSVHLSTGHAAAQLVERLAWAITDAEDAVNHTNKLKVKFVKATADFANAENPAFLMSHKHPAAFSAEVDSNMVVRASRPHLRAKCLRGPTVSIEIASPC